MANTPIQDCMFNALRTLLYTGSLNDMLLQYYQANGATSNVVRDAEYEFLIARGVAGGRSLNTMWEDYFRNVKLYTQGDLRAMREQFWCVDGGTP